MMSIQHAINVCNVHEGQASAGVECELCSQGYREPKCCEHRLGRMMRMRNDAHACGPTLHIGGTVTCKLLCARLPELQADQASVYVKPKVLRLVC
jgi:hypothetical protein